MKALITLIASLISVNASAVSTKNCPDNLIFKYEDVEVTASLKKVLKEALIYEDDQEESVKEAYANLTPKKSVRAVLPLVTAANGRCSYYKKGDTSKARALIYTSNGKDLVMVQHLLGPKGILARVYAHVESLSPSELTLTDDDAGLALAIPRYPYESYSAGGPIVFVGEVKDLEIEALEVKPQ